MSRSEGRAARAEQRTLVLLAECLCISNSDDLVLLGRRKGRCASCPAGGLRIPNMVNFGLVSTCLPPSPDKGMIPDCFSDQRIQKVAKRSAATVGS